MIERKILIGIVTSTEYCNQIKDIFDLTLIESAAAKRMMSWMWDFYKENNEAPKHDAVFLFWKHAKQLPKDVAEEIEEEILPSLETENEAEPFNVSAMVKETEKYFQQRKLSVLSDNIKILIEKDQVEEAEKLATTYKPFETVSNKIDIHILSATEIREQEIVKPITLMSPWLKEGQMTIIYGNFGSGKSLLTILVAYVLGLREYDGKDCEINKWQVKTPTGTLYIDGEIGQQEMEERIKQFEWLGRQSVKHQMKVLSIPEYQLETQDTFNMVLRINQLKIIQWLKSHQEYKLVVLDSVSTLFGLVEENDNSEWNNKINPFLKDLRALGVACLLLHHAGKDGKRGLRGASAMGAMAHNIFRLSDHSKKEKDDGEAWFILSKDKQRQAGFGFRSFGIHYMQNKDKTKTFWEITDY